MASRDPLDDLLERLPGPAHPLPDLRMEIRRELARTAANRESWETKLEAAFARPSFAVAFVAACILLGLFLAEARVSRLHASNGATIARSYVHLIDPLVNETAPTRAEPEATP